MTIYELVERNTRKKDMRNAGHVESIAKKLHRQLLTLGSENEGRLGVNSCDKIREGQMKQTRSYATKTDFHGVYKSEAARRSRVAF